MDTKSVGDATGLRRSALRARVCLVLGDDALVAPAGQQWGPVLKAAHAERVHLVLAGHLRRRGELASLPAVLRRGLEAALAEANAIEALRARELAAVLDALAGRGVRPLLFKGAALAYCAYEDPSWRPRGDIDLLIGRDDGDLVHQAMTEMGFERVRLVQHEGAMHQFQYVTHEPAAMTPTYDFHWRIANPEVFASFLSYDEAARDAVAVPALGPHARRPSDVHALFIACVHRIAHHYDADDLIWLYDIHLLAGGLTDAEWRAFTSLASDRKMRAVSARSLTRAIEAFETPVPAWVHEALSGATGEPSQIFLDGSPREIDIQRANARELPTWRARARFAWRHLFPDHRHVLGTYRVTNPLWLPVLYVHRIARGALRWLRPARRK